MASLGFNIQLDEGQQLPTQKMIGPYHFVAMGFADQLGITANYSITDSRSVDWSNQNPQVFTCNFRSQLTGGISPITLIQYFSVEEGSFIQANSSNENFKPLLEFFSDLIGCEIVSFDFDDNGRIININNYPL